MYFLFPQVSLKQLLECARVINFFLGVVTTQATSETLSSCYSLGHGVPTAVAVTSKFEFKLVQVYTHGTIFIF